MKSHASMNRIYRLVWNAALSLWVAVAENARGRGKGGSARGSVLFGSAPDGDGGGGTGFTLNTACRAALVLLTSLAVISHEARAADAANASVSAGAAGISTVGNTTTINQSTQRVAIDWTSLSTAANEALKFNQPNAAAIALNRITGSSPSELLGSLTANGQVFILNPNGVLFGAGSQVNVGGLVASTLNMSNADFMAGNHVFTNSGGTGSVVNQGTLTAAGGGYLALLAPEVRNEGVMTASLGTALLAAGNKVTLNLDNGSLLGYSIDQGAINALAENKQLIKADGGQVLLGARALDSLTTATVNNTGIIEAKTLQNKAGRIMLIGDMEHGMVNIGGTLDASAPDGGDGGFIETSAAHFRILPGAKVTTLAPHGKTGTWLLDPTNVTIAGGTGGAADTFYEDTLEVSGSDIVIQATDSVTVAGTFSNGDLEIAPGLNLTIQTTGTSGSGIDLTGSTDGANLNFKVSGGGNVTMTTASAGQVLKASRITVADGAGTISLNSAGQLDVSGTTLQTAGGAITLSGAGTSLGDGVKISNSTINAGTGATTITGSTTTGNFGVLLESGAVMTGGGNVSINGSGADIGFADTAAITTTGDVYLTGRNIQQGGTGTAITANKLAIRASGYIGNSAAAVTGDDKLNTQVNTLSAVAAGAISVSNTGALTVDTATFGGSAVPGGAIAGVSSTGGAIALATVDTGGATDNLTLNKAVSTTGGSANTIALAADDHYLQNGVTVSTTSANADGANVTISARRTASLTGASGVAINTSGANGAVGVNGYTAGNIQVTTSGASSGSITSADSFVANGGSANNANNADVYALTGGNGGNISMATAGTGAAIAIGGSLQADGGQGSGGSSGNRGVGGNGGTVALSTTGGSGANAISTGEIRTRGGLAGYVGQGGNAGNVTVSTISAGAASITTGHILASGGAAFGQAALGYSGGDGGNVTLSTAGAGAGITTGVIDAHGEVASVSTGPSGLHSGKGGTISVTTTGANSSIATGALSSYSLFAACHNNRSCTVRPAGNVTVTAASGSIGINGGVDAHGGAAIGASIVKSGAAAGNVLITAGGLNNSVRVNGGINASGGDGANGGNGGAAGTVTVTASGIGGTGSNVAIAGGISAVGGAGNVAGASKAVVVTASDGYVWQAAGNYFNGASVAVTANRGIGAGNTGLDMSGATAPDMSSRLGVAAANSTARNALGNVATRAGALRVAYAGGSLALSNQFQNGFTAGDFDLAVSSGDLSVGGVTRTGSANLSLSASGNLTTTDYGLLYAAGGNIRLEAGAGIGIGYQSRVETTGDIYISAGGNVTQTNDYNAFIANNLAIRAGALVGEGVGNGRLVTQVNNLSVFAGYGVNLYNNTALNIGSVTFGGGTVPGGAIDGVTSAAGSITLGSGGVMGGTGTVRASTTSVNLSAAGGINLNVDTASLTATDTSGPIAITLAYGGTVENVATTGAVNLTAMGGDLNLKTVSGSDVTLGATYGAITDANGTDNNITANTLTASSQNGIALGTDVSGMQTLSTAGATADISISTARAIDTANYNISTDTGSAQNVSLTSSSASGITVGNTFASTNDNISLTATAGGINLTSAIDAAGLALSAQGGIIAPAAIHVSGVFDLQAGTFRQVGTLPTFSAGDFRISGGTFVRALGGDGLTAGTAYQIADIYGLQGADSAGMRDKKFKLANNIDASGTAGWNSDGAATPTYAGFRPIGAGAGFTGTLDGDGHVIDQLFINMPLSISGLFGTLQGTVSNLGLTGGSVAGSISGALAGTNRGSITNSYSSVAVNGGASAGGLVGNNVGFISNSYATGDVAGNVAGGLVGANYTSVSGSYAAGAVTGGISGGLVGASNDGTVSNSFWDTQTTGQASSAGGTGKTTAEMRQAQTFTDAGWSASNVGGDGTTWRIYEGNTGPLLRGFMTGLALADTSVTYNGNTQAGVTTVTAGVSGSNVTARNAGSYLTGYYSGQQGYDIIGGGLDIAKADLTLTTTGVTKTYDGTTTATGSAVATAGTALLGGDTASGGVFEFTSKNFGVGDKSVTTASVTVNDGNGGNNYNVSYADNTTSTINKANLTVTATGVTKTYDGTTSATGTGSVGTLAGDAAGEVVNAAATQAFTDKNFGIGNRTVQASGLTIKDSGNADVTGNYNIAYVDNNTSTINKADLTVTATGVTKTYDGTLGATGTGSVGTLAGAGAGESVNAAATQAFTDKNFGIGNKTVQASGLTIKDSGNADVTGNYNIAYVDNTASTINKADLTVTATSVTKTYDGTLGASGNGSVGALAGAGAGDSVNASATQVFIDKNFGIGNKTVQATGLTIKDGGNVDVTGNYNIAYVDNTTGTINKANVTLSTSDVTKTYDGGMSAAGAVVVTAGQVFTGDNATGGTFAFTDKNFGVGNKTVTTAGVTVGDGVNNANYNVSYADNTTSTINKANLTLSTTNVTKTYDGTLAASGIAAVAGGTVFSGDSISGGGFTFTDKNFGAGNKTVTAAGVTVNDGNSGNNYNVSYADNTTSTINKADLTVTATGVTKTYDGTLVATGSGSVGTLAGAGAGESVNAAATQVFTDKNFGIGNKTVQASGLTIKDSGNADVTGNYNIAYVDNTASTINKADVTVTATGVTRTYDGTTAATGSGTVAALAGAAAGEAVNAGGSQAFLDKNAGTGNKAVRASGVTIKDAGNSDVTGNYNIAYVDNTASTIDKADLTLSTSSVTKTYDGGLSAAGTVVVTAGTVFAGDSATGGSFAFTDKNFGMGNKTVAASGVTVGDGVNNANYNVSYADNTTSTINKADLTVTATGVTKTYDGTTSATGTGSVGTLAGAGAGEAVNAAATQIFTDKNFGIGNKTVQASGLTIKDSGNADVTGNYNIAYVDNTGSTINKADLTVTATGVTKTYDGTLAATGTGSVGALAGAGAGEVVNTAATQVFADKNFGIGNKRVEASGLTIKDSGNVDVTGNYNIAYVDNTTSTINKADVTLSTSDVTKTYDGGLSASGAVVLTAGTVFSGDNATGGTFAFTDKNFGAGNKTVQTSGVTVGDGVNNDNYNVTYANNNTSTINQANLTLSTTNVTKSYDGTLSASGAATVTAGTVFSGDSLNGGTFAFTDKNFGVGNKTVTATGVTVGDGVNNGNYNVSYVDNTTSTINKADLTVTATGVTKTYDGTLAATGNGSVGTLAGAGAGESVNTAATQLFTDKNFGLGNKTVQASGLTIKDSSNADVTGNYNIAYVDNSISTINKADVTLSTSDVTKTYDGTTGATGAVVVTAGTVFTGDNATGGTFAFTDKNFGVGNKTVQTSGVTVGDGVNNANYNVTYAANTTSTINQASLVLTTNNVTKTYDGNTTAAGSATVAGGTLFGGDSLTGGSFAFTDKNAGNGNKTVTSAGVTVGDGVNNGNYNVTYADNTTSTINPFAVSLSGTRSYDGTANVAAGVLNIGPLVGSETLGLAGNATMADKNVGANKALAVAGLGLTNGSGLASNYTFTGGTQQASITQAGLTVGTGNVTKTYDSTTTAAGTAVVTGGTLFGGDSLMGGSFAFTDKNAGAGNKTVTTSGVTVGDGVNNGNYAVTYASNTTSTINKADLTVTASGVDKVYDGTTAATVALSDNGFMGDVINLSGNAAFADKNAGAGKAVNVNGISTSGTDAGNYNLLNSSTSTTASITPKALAVTANDDVKNYDGAAYSGGNGVSYNGFVAGDSSADIGGALAYGGSSQGAVVAGSYVITPGGLNSVSGNYTLGFAGGALSITASNASTAALGSAALVGAYDGALQAVAGVGGSSGGSGGGGGFGGSADAMAGALSGAAAEAGNSGEE